MVETGRLINRRYLLQRFIRQGQCCAIYQGTDQVLQRPVAVKIVPATYLSIYQTAIRVTAQFSHPNIIDLYDLIIEPGALYIIQEYVEGDDFATLLQTQLQPYQVAEMGVQLCQALLYASSGAHNVCHGDLTPSAIIRDRRGVVRINNFALPSDLNYFSAWSVVGAEGKALLDSELPWGQQSMGRCADDARAVGLLLYQLLAGRAPGTTLVEPPLDGRLRFTRNMPVELCDVVARAVIRQHPQHLNTVEALYAELKTLADWLEPMPAPSLVASGMLVGDAGSRQFSPPGTGKLVTALPMRDIPPSPAAVAIGTSALGNEQAQRLVLDAATTTQFANGGSAKLVTVRPPFSPETDAQRSTQTRRVSFPLLLLMGLLIFGLFFTVGYFTATTFFHP